MIRGSRASLLLLAFGFYLLLCLAALAWGLIEGRPNILVSSRALGTVETLWWLVGGIATGGLVVLASRLSERTHWARELNRWFASLLGPLTWVDALILALLSGIAEELFFRGAMQPTVGLWLTSLAFMLVHLPPRLSLAPWTLMTGVLGLGFGHAAELGGNLAFPIAAHFTVNFLNLKNLAKYAPEAEGKDPP